MVPYPRFWKETELRRHFRVRSCSCCCASDHSTRSPILPLIDRKLQLFHVGSTHSVYSPHTTRNVEPSPPPRVCRVADRPPGIPNSTRTIRFVIQATSRRRHPSALCSVDQLSSSTHDLPTWENDASRSASIFRLSVNRLLFPVQVTTFPDTLRCERRIPASARCHGIGQGHNRRAMEQLSIRSRPPSLGTVVDS